MKFLKKNEKSIKKTSKVELGTLYDVNKNLVQMSIPDMTKEDLQNKKNMVVDFINQSNNEYFMMLCNERKDYTIFHRNRKNDNGEFLDLSEGYKGDFIEKVLIDECLPNRGNVKSLELTKNKDAIEIWISIDGESFCYYFFPYDIAVIQC